MFKPHAGVKVFFVDCFVDSRSYEASCSRWNRVLLPMMARRTSCCLPYLRSRKEIFFFVMSCGDFFLTFDFRSLNFGPFSLIAPKREAEERLNSEQQELSSLQSELIDAEVRLCTCQVAFMYWNSFEFQGQSIFFCIFHSTFKLSWCDLRPGQRAASKTLKRNRKLSTRQPDSICIRKADLNRKSLVPNEIDDWQATSLVSMLRVELNSEQAKWKSWKFKSIFF